MAKSANSTAKYVEFNKAEMSPACQKLDAELGKLNAAAGKVREAYVKQLEADHGEVIKAASPNGLVYQGISLNFGKLSGRYDLPGSGAPKSSGKAISLK